MLFFQLPAGCRVPHTRISSRLRLAAAPQVIVHVAIVSGCLLLMGALALIWQSPITPGVELEAC